MEGSSFISRPRGQMADCTEAVVVVGHAGDKASSEYVVCSAFRIW